MYAVPVNVRANPENLAVSDRAWEALMDNGHGEGAPPGSADGG
jgi:hypothetical protein